MEGMTPNVKPKTIVCLYAPANSGKTKTIRSLFVKLGGDKRTIEQNYDFTDDVCFGKKMIGFVSQGDPGTPLFKNLEQYAQKGHEIIVTASRTKGGTVDDVCNVAMQYGYNVVWISPAYLNDASYGTDDIFLHFADRNADSLMRYIIDQLI